MKKENLIGQKFGELLVISEANNIYPKNGNGRSFTAWNCRCSCDKIIIIRAGTLKSGKQKSCGCIKSKSGKALKPGQKLHRLLTISYNNGYWTCLCECGNNTNVLTHHLISGNTKSCGCLKTEINNSPLKLKKFATSNKKYDPQIASARRLWKSYYYQDKKCNISFDEWFKLSQQNCFYCNDHPSNKYNYFLKKQSSQEAKDNGEFIYNGLDRVDNFLPHIINNVVSCCWTCNRAKNERSLNEFYRYIDDLKSITAFDPPKYLLKMPGSYLLTSIKSAYRHYIKNYKIMEIDLKTFYTYSQLPCFYCGDKNTNHLNVYLKDKKASQKAKDNAYFDYNGIDRLDNTKPHTINNIVPCCYYCNFAKGNLSLSDFQDWILRIKNYQKTKKPAEAGF